MLKVENLKKVFRTEEIETIALNGVTFEVKEGEFVAVMGPSGCGKSTLGRTLLQFYKQTDGRTMYYGRKVNEIAPEYVKDVIKNLPSLYKKYEELDAKRREVRAHYEKLDEKSQYAEKEKLDHAEKEANDAFLDMANVVGGLMTVKDLKPVQDAYMAEYELLVKIKKLREKRQESELDLADAEYQHQQLKESGKEDRLKFYFHRRLVEGTLPLSVGGGIGQSRLCMLYLRKAHIGEIQASIWPEDMRKECKEHNIHLI